MAKKRLRKRQRAFDPVKNIRKFVKLEPLGGGEVSFTVISPGGVSVAKRMKVASVERALKSLDELRAWVASVIVEAKKPRVGWAGKIRGRRKFVT